MSRVLVSCLVKWIFITNGNGKENRKRFWVSCVVRAILFHIDLCEVSVSIAISMTSLLYHSNHMACFIHANIKHIGHVQCLLYMLDNIQLGAYIMTNCIRECAHMVNGAGVGTCAYGIIWYMHGYLRCYDNFAHVRGYAFINEVSFCNRKPGLLKNAMIALPVAATFLEELFQQYVGRQV